MLLNSRGSNFISIYVRAIGISPSGYYRILQYLTKLNLNIKLRNLVPPTLYKYYLQKRSSKLKFILNIFIYFVMYFRIIFYLLNDYINKPNVIIISRSFLPRFLMPPISLIIKIISSQCDKIIWDFDDDIITGKEITPKEFKLLEKISSHIIVTHSYLASKLDPQALCKCQILPTTDGDFEPFDIRSQILTRVKSLNSNLKIIWIGSAVNLRYLQAAVIPLDRTAKFLNDQYKISVNLLVCSSEELNEKTTNLKITNIKWSPENSIKAVLESHIGIMPLFNEPYALGKGGFKLIQYMAAGLPIIGSNVGFNNTIINDKFGRLIKDLESSEEWCNAINDLIITPKEYIKAATQSRDEYERSFHFDNNLSVWQKILS